MLQMINMPISEEIALQYGGWPCVQERCKAIGLSGIEGIWDGSDHVPKLPDRLLQGYHLTFWPDWLDFWRGDRKALISKYGSDGQIRLAYGSLDPEYLLEVYRQDLERAVRYGARYVVFHVSDVSIEEGYNYSWLHTDREVVDASLEVINKLLGSVSCDLDFLVENQWWPGFTFTDPGMTDRLLSGIRFGKPGIMLDTGHLMNCRRALRSQREGIRYIEKQLAAHGALSKEIRGLHLHQSLSGRYVSGTVGRVTPPEGDYVSRFCESYGHITRIDRHRAWTEPAVAELVRRIDPKYLTHELSAVGEKKFRDTKAQVDLLK